MQLPVHAAIHRPAAIAITGRRNRTGLAGDGLTRVALAYSINGYNYKQKRGETITWSFKDYAGDDVEVHEVPVPAKIRNPDPIVAAFRRDRIRELGRENADRAARMLQAFVLEARRLGFDIHNEDRLRDISVCANGRDYGIKVKMLPDGRIELALYQWRGQPLKVIRDAKTVGVEQKLSLLFHAIGMQRIEDEQRKDAREVEDARLTAEWEVAMESARTALREHRRASALHEELERWELAERMRTYASSLDDASGNDEDRAAWIEWILRHADSIDPRNSPVGLPKPRPYRLEELTPFLGGLRPDRPTFRGLTWPAASSGDERL